MEVSGRSLCSYPKFNAIARRLFTRLKQLGARPLLDIGLGDDQSGYGMEGKWDNEKELSLVVVFTP